MFAVKLYLTERKEKKVLYQDGIFFSFNIHNIMG